MKQNKINKSNSLTEENITRYFDTQTQKDLIIAFIETWGKCEFIKLDSNYSHYAAQALYSREKNAIELNEEIFRKIQTDERSTKTDKQTLFGTIIHELFHAIDYKLGINEFLSEKSWGIEKNYQAHILGYFMPDFPGEYFSPALKMRLPGEIIGHSIQDFLKFGKVNLISLPAMKTLLKNDSGYLQKLLNLDYIHILINNQNIYNAHTSLVKKMSSSSLSNQSDEFSNSLNDRSSSIKLYKLEPIDIISDEKINKFLKSNLTNKTEEIELEVTFLKRIHFEATNKAYMISFKDDNEQTEHQFFVEKNKDSFFLENIHCASDLNMENNQHKALLKFVFSYFKLQEELIDIRLNNINDIYYELFFLGILRTCMNTAISTIEQVEKQCKSMPLTEMFSAIKELFKKYKDNIKILPITINSESICTDFRKKLVMKSKALFLIQMNLCINILIALNH